MIGLFSNIFQAEQIMWARPISTAGLVAAFVAVVALTVYLYRRKRGVPTRIHIVLTVSRLIVLSLIVAALLEPTAVVKQTRTVKRRLPVLIDVSESMSVKDQRMRPEDLVEAAAALDMLPISETSDTNMAFNALDAKQHLVIELIVAAHMLAAHGDAMWVRQIEQIEHVQQGLLAGSLVGIPDQNVLVGWVDGGQCVGVPRCLTAGRQEGGGDDKNGKQAARRM